MIKLGVDLGLGLGMSGPQPSKFICKKYCFSGHQIFTIEKKKDVILYYIVPKYLLILNYKTVRVHNVKTKMIEKNYLQLLNYSTNYAIIISISIN